MEIWKCKWCLVEKQLESKFTKSGHLARCSKWLEFKRLNLTKEVLTKLYVDEHMSLPEIAEHLGIDSVSTIHQALKKEGVPIRSVSESRTEERQWKRYAATSMNNSGVEHNFKFNAPSRLEWQRRLLKTEGITNVFQRQEVKEKIRQSMLVEYGVENPASLPRLGRSTFTKPHRWMVECLQGLGHEVSIELKLATDTSFVSYDIWIHGTKKLIEVHGDYWHACPLFYKPTDRILYGSHHTKTAQEIWDRDAQKLALAKANGYEVLVVWQHEINQEPSKVREKVIEYSNAACQNQVYSENH